VEAVEVHELMDRFGRGVPDEDAAGIPQCVLVEGRLA
jgi:hypothetical protein